MPCFRPFEDEGSGNGGNLTVNTGRLIIEDGGAIDVGTASSGNAGSVNIIATESVEVTGNENTSSRLLAQVGRNATGTGGNIRIETRRLTATFGSQISAATFGSGQGGSLTAIATEGIELSGLVSAESRGGP